MLKKYFILFLLSLFSTFSYCQNAIDITNKMFEKSKTVKTLSLKIISKERFGKEYKTVEAYIKKQVSPVKIYFKQLNPPTNAEVLINEKYTKKAQKRYILCIITIRNETVRIISVRRSRQNEKEIYQR